MSAEEKDGGLQKRTDREAGEETECSCVCVCVWFFLLIQIRFHKDPHDCLITTGTQKGMRWRDEADASRDMKKLINSCMPFAQLLSLFFPECFFPLGELYMIILTVCLKKQCQ